MPLTQIPLHEDDGNVDLVKKLPSSRICENVDFVTFDVHLHQCCFRPHQRKKVIEKDGSYWRKSVARFVYRCRFAFCGVYQKCVLLVSRMHAHVESRTNIGDGVVYQGDVGTDRTEVDGLGKSRQRARVGLDSQDLRHTSSRQRVQTHVSTKCRLTASVDQDEIVVESDSHYLHHSIFLST